MFPRSIEYPSSFLSAPPCSRACRPALLTSASEHPCYFFRSRPLLCRHGLSNFIISSVIEPSPRPSGIVIKALRLLPTDHLFWRSFDLLTAGLPTAVTHDMFVCFFQRKCHTWSFHAQFFGYFLLSGVYSTSFLSEFDYSLSFACCVRFSSFFDRFHRRYCLSALDGGVLRFSL